MKRNEFLKSLTLMAAAPMTFVGLNACKKDDDKNTSDPEDDFCKATPSEVVGPFPTKNPSAFSSATITSDRVGTPLTIQIFIRNRNNSCAAVEGVLVDIWHCDADGNYSEYGGVLLQETDYTNEHFLRGRQTTDSNGMASFSSIYPGWYPGRAPHIHVHIYTASGTSLLVTQIAFPDNISSSVYNQGVYASHGLADTSNAGDNTFNDSIATELATVTGNATEGYLLTHAINVKA